MQAYIYRQFTLFDRLVALKKAGGLIVAAIPCDLPQPKDYKKIKDNYSK